MILDYQRHEPLELFTLFVRDQFPHLSYGVGLEVGHHGPHYRVSHHSPHFCWHGHFDSELEAKAQLHSCIFNRDTDLDDVFYAMSHHLREGFFGTGHNLTHKMVQFLVLNRIIAEKQRLCFEFGQKQREQKKPLDMLLFYKEAQRWMQKDLVESPQISPGDLRALNQDHGPVPVS